LFVLRTTPWLSSSSTIRASCLTRAARRRSSAAPICGAWCVPGAAPKKLTGYTGLCPIVRQSGNRDVRGPLAKNGPKYLRWALVEAATHAARDVRYRDRYERNKKRLGRQRGAKVARIDIARQLAEAIWHVLTKNEPFAPVGPAILLVA
jgi:hypothetical protein